MILNLIIAISWECFSAEIDESAVIKKALKSVSVSKEEKDQLFKQGGGFLSRNKKLHNCPKCVHGYVDEPPSNKIALKKNAEETAVWKKQRKKLEDFEMGASNDFPTDKNGRQLLQIVAPKLVPLLGHCHCVQLHVSFTNPILNCPVNGEDPKTKVQHPRGECPIWKCTCSFIYDLKKHDESWLQLRSKKAKTCHHTNKSGSRKRLFGSGRKDRIPCLQSSNPFSRPTKREWIASFDRRGYYPPIHQSRVSGPCYLHRE